MLLAISDNSFRPSTLPSSDAQNSAAITKFSALSCKHTDRIQQLLVTEQYRNRPKRTKRWIKDCLKAFNGTEIHNGVWYVTWCFTPSQPLRLYQGDDGVRPCHMPVWRTKPSLGAYFPANKSSLISSESTVNQAVKCPSLSPHFKSSFMCTTYHLNSRLHTYIINQPWTGSSSESIYI